MKNRGGKMVAFRKIIEELSDYSKSNKADSFPVGTNTVIEVEVDRLKSSPLNKFIAVSTEKHQEMLESIKKDGIIVPLQVRPIKDTSDYEILAGHNRTTIAKEIGLETVPVIVCDVDDVEAIKIIYATNQE